MKPVPCFASANTVTTEFVALRVKPPYPPTLGRAGIRIFTGAPPPTVALRAAKQRQTRLQEPKL